MTKLFARLPPQLKLPLVSGIFGIAGGLTAVAFMIASGRLFYGIWVPLTTRGTGWFLLGSLLVIGSTSLAAGWIMARYCPEAAGSGIPQLKTAYWNDMGAIPFRATLTKFVAGIITLAGGASLGREGPTVFIAGGVASWLAGRLGVHRRKRRQAAVAGAAAGLAAAFNTPLAAICFLLEEILGDFNSRLMGAVMLASIAGAFVVHTVIGSNPSFVLPTVADPSWPLYVALPTAAVVASLAGVLFQYATLRLRQTMLQTASLPSWSKPLAGSIVVWAIGSSVYLLSGSIGVFGVGGRVLSNLLNEGVVWRLALLLAVGKLAATIFSYGTGGCGGIFSPTLFIGAMCGFLTADVFGQWLPLTRADRVIIAAAGMSACFAAVARAPVTSVLMVFEMTHQFSMVPALMISTIISQTIARLAGPHSFYDAILQQDGQAVHHRAVPRNLAIWRGIEISALCTRQPAVLRDLSPGSIRQTLARYPYHRFPCLPDGQPPSVATRAALEHALALGTAPRLEPAVVFEGSQTLGDVEALLVTSESGLYLVRDTPGGPVNGVFTLHDLIRAQGDFFES